jgi:hypothetical protein
METNVFKPGAVMDLVANAQVEKDTETIEAAVNKQQINNYRYLGKTKTIIREYEKISRNDKCPCGSGKKYKNCCLSTGKFEQHHQLTTVEASNVKNGDCNLSSLKKNAYDVNTTVEEGA